MDLKRKIFVAFIFFSISCFTQNANSLSGYWKSCDEGDNMVVKVVIKNNLPIGYLEGFLRDNGTWEKNKPKKGIKVMYDFLYKGNLKWSKGKIYDPITKRTYRGVIKLINKDTIQATGYWGFLWDDILFRRIQLSTANEPKS